MLPEPDDGGRRRRVKAFIFTPNVSRYRLVYVSEREGTEEAIKACEAAWEFYGGVFDVLLVDNTKAIIEKADPLGAKVGDTFLEYSQARDFVVDTTRVRDPDGTIVKVHPRKPKGGRSIDRDDFPAHKQAYAMRDVDFLQKQASGHGEAIGLMAAALLEGPLPWTRMRQVYALLSLVKRYGAERVEPACGRALPESMHNIRRLQRMIEQDVPDVPERTAQVIPLSRYLRPENQYALKRPNKEKE